MTITHETVFAPALLPRIKGSSGQISADHTGPFEWHMPENANMAELCCDRWARTQPERVALLHVEHTGQSQSWTYAKLHQCACNLASKMVQLGIGEGDRIGLLLTQGPEVLIAHFAAYRIGAIIVPLFTLFGPDALHYRLKDSGTKLLIADQDQIEKLLPILPELDALKHLFICGRDLNITDSLDIKVSLFEQAIGEDVNVSEWPADSPPDNPAMIIYTSGTTGPPKGTLHAHRFLLGHLPNVEISHNGFPQQGDKGWTPADWAWIGGLMDLAMPCLYYGVLLVARRFVKFEAETAWQFIAENHIRNMFLPPTALKMMRHYALEHGLPATLTIRSIASGGEALPQTLIAWAKDQFNLDINEIYGQTECNLVICSNRSVEPLPDGAMGKAVPGHHVAIIDDEGKLLKAGMLGQIAVKPPDPVMFLQYWNKPEKTREKFINGWLCTGDMGSCDENGFFTFTARDDDVITTSGYRVGPSEIENALMQHARVQMAAIIGLPDPDRTEKITACIVPDQQKNLDILENELKLWIKQRVSLHLMPRAFYWFDQLPLTATGKIMRKALRQSILEKLSHSGE